MVSGVSFRAGALDSARDILDQPQKHSRPAGAAAPEAKADEYVAPKKKHTARNAIIGTLVAAAAIVGGLVAGHKLGGFNKVIEKAGAEGAGKVMKFLGQAAEKANTAGEWLAAKGVKAFETVKGLFKKGEETASA